MLEPLQHTRSVISFDYYFDPFFCLDMNVPNIMSEDCLDIFAAALSSPFKTSPAAADIIIAHFISHTQTSDHEKGHACLEKKKAAMHRK